jgi:hypothetical protein
MKSFFLTRLLPILALVVALSVAASAQPGSGGPGPTPTVDPTETPIDGGASLLLAGGVAYGLKHLRNRRKKA